MKATNPPNWPIVEYANAWMAFRRASRENTIIGNWMASQDAWPKRNSLRLTDIGCGDGKVVGDAIMKCIAAGFKIGSVLLIDPHQLSLDAAAEHVQLVANIHPDKFAGRLSGALDKIPEKVLAVDAILFIHVVYLMPNQEFLELLDRLPKGVPLYVAFDEPNSVFSMLWKKTAEPFLECVIDAHNTISLLPMDSYRVTETKLVSEFDRKLIEPGGPQAKLLVSMLCYNDKFDISPNSDFGRYFAKVVDSNTKDGKVQCRFVGYQIVKR